MHRQAPSCVAGLCQPSISAISSGSLSLRKRQARMVSSLSPDLRKSARCAVVRGKDWPLAAEVFRSTIYTAPALTRGPQAELLPLGGPETSLSPILHKIILP